MTKTQIKKKLDELENTVDGNEIHETPNLVFMVMAKTLILIAQMIFTKIDK